MALQREDYQERHHHRKRIIEDNLLQYKEGVLISERNRNVVEEYVYGKSYGDIAREKGISNSRVEQIIHCYIRHCVLLKNKTGPYEKQ